MVYHCKMSFSDAKNLPTYQRRWFVERTRKEFEAEKKQIESASKKGRK